ncbi:MAG TPA: hypothetical protein VI299_24515 [Polyangiales bacterium]
MSWAKWVASSSLALGLAGALASARSAQAQAKPSTAGETATANVDFEALEHELPPGDEPPPQVAPLGQPTVTVTKAQDASTSGRPYGRKAALFDHVRLDAHVALTWDGAFGAGIRAEWLLIEGTFKYSTRDELAISAGTDLTFVSFDGSQVIEAFPTVALQWSIGVDDRLFFFPEFGLLGHVQGGKWEGLYPNIGFGGRYYLARSIGLQARFGWPIAFSAGAVF